METFRNFQEIQDLKNQCENCNHTEFWFRGQSKPFYKLLPSLYRLNLGKNIEVYQEFEQKSYDLFEQKCNELSVPIPSNSWERVCFMQHYGVKTKFLDWSKSFDIALFFAFEGWNPLAKNPDERIATVWVLEPNILNLLSGRPSSRPRESSILVPKKDEENYSYAKFLDSKINNLEGSLAIDLTNNLSTDSEPNKRIKAQKGVFTMHETTLDLESELTFRKDYGKSHQKTYVDETLRRIDLKPELYNEVKDYLNNKKLLHHTIYPDIQGISTTINRLGIGERDWYEVF
ncbi:FRG domain-containing protein [Bacillus wiedmannii]